MSCCDVELRTDLQAVHAAEGGSSTDRHGREARAGRLTRQKVRCVSMFVCMSAAMSLRTSRLKRSLACES